MSNIGPNDLIFYSDPQGDIHSGGFSVKSIMMKEGFSPIITLNNTSQNGGGNQVSNLFENLVIPNWALHIPEIKKGGDIYNNKKHNNKYDEDADDYISDDLYDRLLDLAKVNEEELKGGKNKKRQTKKLKANKHKFTKRK
jgi:hypothetical protein